MVINRKKALVLGGVGLVGSNLANELAKSFDVTVVDKRQAINKISGVKYIVSDAFDYKELNEIINTLRPSLIVNAINIATIFSSNPEANYKKLIQFFYHLYQILSKLNYKLNYIQIGTTGSGGLGFDIPFTHGDHLEDLPIINKAAFAGISTAMLTLLSRSMDEKISVYEIKPGLSIFRKDICNSTYHKCNLVTVDGGESGLYTYNELALLTCYMGFTTVDTIVDKIKNVLSGGSNIHRHCIHDTIASLNTSIIEQSKRDRSKLHHTIKRMKNLSGENYIIATGKLGPPAITRDLILSFIKNRYPNLSQQEFENILITDVSANGTLQYIKENEKTLYEFLLRELNYSNYTELNQVKPEPWENIKTLLSQ